MNDLPDGRYTFANFIVAPSNRDAYGACVRVSEQPGVLHNPLVILSTHSGNGGTHLTRAICHAPSARLRSDTVRMVSAEHFMNHLIEASAANQMDDFLHQYLESDALLVDAVGFLEGKPRTSAWLAHIARTMLQRGEQVVFNGHVWLEAEAAMQTLLLGATVVQISAPEPELKKTIALGHAQSHGLDLDDVMLDQIVVEAGPSVRAVIGIVNRLIWNLT